MNLAQSIMEITFEVNPSQAGCGQPPWENTYTTKSQLCRYWSRIWCDSSCGLSPTLPKSTTKCTKHLLKSLALTVGLNPVCSEQTSQTTGQILLKRSESNNELQVYSWLIVAVYSDPDGRHSHLNQNKSVIFTDIKLLVIFNEVVHIFCHFSTWWS